MDSARRTGALLLAALDSAQAEGTLLKVIILLLIRRGISNPLGEEADYDYDYEDLQNR